jgi:hypothetical protein
MSDQPNNIIFAIDDNNNPFIRGMFEAEFDEGRATGNLIRTIGSWEKITEWSYVCNREDFNEIVVNGKYVVNQECVLAVTSCNKAYAQLEDLDTGAITQVGCMHSVTYEEAMKSKGYTYRPDTNAYWVAKRGNPDNSFRESKARTGAGEYL